MGKYRTSQKIDIHTLTNFY